nr:hypothetical protein [Clostridia bacterium]
MKDFKQLVIDFVLSKFGVMTEDICALTDKKFPLPSQKIRPVHPRVNLTADMIPAIRAAFDDPHCAKAVETFNSYLASDYDGILGAPEQDYLGRKGLHNFDPEGVAKIEAKALNYLLTGDERWGYEAIYILLNFIDTLDIQYIASDGCREFGCLLHCAAEVYD